MSEHLHQFSTDKMHLLDTPDRHKLMPPKELLDMVLQTQDTVVDLGAGTGYFTLPAAQMTNGTVYAVDVEPKMLEVLEQRVEEHALSNVTPITGGNRGYSVAGWSRRCGNCIPGTSRGEAALKGPSRNTPYSCIGWKTIVPGF